MYTKTKTVHNPSFLRRLNSLPI